MTRIKCKVARIQENRIEVDGRMVITPIVKLVPTESIGDFYFAVPGGKVVYRPEEWAKSPDGKSQKLILEANTVPLAVTTEDGDTYTVDQAIEIDVAPLRATKNAG